MRLIKGKSIDLLTFEKTFVRETGQTSYSLIDTDTLLVSVCPFKASMTPDFQIDLARLKDYLMLISNTEILTDGSQLVRVKDLYYLPFYDEDTKYLDNRTGKFKIYVKLNVDQAYGVSNG